MPTSGSGFGKRVRTSSEKKADLADIAHLHLKGHTAKEIAEWISSHRDYRISRSQISSDVKEVEKLWETATVEALHKMRMKAKAELELVKREAWAAWEASKKDKVHRNQLVEKDADGEHKVSRVTMESREGNGFYLQQIIGANKEISLLMGLYAPEKKEVTGADGAPLGAGQVIIELPDNGRPAYGEGDVKVPPPCEVERNGNTNANDGE